MVVRFIMNFTPEQQQKIDSFQWKEIEETDIPQPEMTVCDAILECVEKVGEYVVDHLNILDLQQDVYSINVPVEVHPLLAERFNSKWSEYSRSRVFDIIRAVFIQKLDDSGCIEKIARKIREVLKSDSDIIITQIDFYDEPEVDVSVIEREIQLHASHEKVVSTRSYQYSGNTITVDLKIDIKEKPKGLLSDLSYNLDDDMYPSPE